MIELNGSMSLLTDGTNYLLKPNGGTAVKLSYNGAPVTVGQFGGWTPIAAAQTATGYEVAFEAGGLRSVYDLEHRQQRQLPLKRLQHGVGIERPAGIVRARLQRRSERRRDAWHSSLASLTAIEASGVDQPANGRDQLFSSICWRVADCAELFRGACRCRSIWRLDPDRCGADGDRLRGSVEAAGRQSVSGCGTPTAAAITFRLLLGPVSGTSAALWSTETIFNDDLNGDGSIGIPPPKVIELSGSMSLVTDWTNYLLEPNGGTPVTLSYNGAPVTVGQFGAWTPIAAQQTATGYEVALEEVGAGLYAVWDTDSSGNYVSGPLSNVSGTSAALELMELSFNDDLNGDGIIGVPVPSNATLIEFIGHDQPAGGWEHLSDSAEWPRGGSAELWRAAGGGRRIWRLDSNRGAANGERI